MKTFAHIELSPRDQALDAIAKQIREAKSLHGLFESLVEFEAECRVVDDDTGQETDIEHNLDDRGLNIAELPNFGGDEPENTTGVWSWDEDSILTGEGPFTNWRIESRDDQVFFSDNDGNRPPSGRVKRITLDEARERFPDQDKAE